MKNSKSRKQCNTTRLRLERLKVLARTDAQLAGKRRSRALKYRQPPCWWWLRPWANFTAPRRPGQAMIAGSYEGDCRMGCGIGVLERSRVSDHQWRQRTRGQLAGGLVSTRGEKPSPAPRASVWGVGDPSPRPPCANSWSAERPWERGRDDGGPERGTRPCGAGVFCTQQLLSSPTSLGPSAHLPPLLSQDNAAEPLNGHTVSTRS
jgi:hypothetical protein